MLYKDDEGYKRFSESWQDPPRRGLHIRITQKMLGFAGLKIAAWLGKRREKKQAAKREAMREAAERWRGSDR